MPYLVVVRYLSNYACINQGDSTKWNHLSLELSCVMQLYNRAVPREVVHDTLFFAAVGFPCTPAAIRSSRRGLRTLALPAMCPVKCPTCSAASRCCADCTLAQAHVRVVPRSPAPTRRALGPPPVSRCCTRRAPVPRRHSPPARSGCHRLRSSTGSHRQHWACGGQRGIGSVPSGCPRRAVHAAAGHSLRHSSPVAVCSHYAGCGHYCGGANHASSHAAAGRLGNSGKRSCPSRADERHVAA